MAWEAELNETRPPLSATGAARERLRAGRRLRPHERARLAAEIVHAYLLARGALRRAPIESALAALRDGTEQATPGARGSDAGADAALAEARRLGRAVSRLLRLMPGDTRCLMRSLVLIRILARRGMRAELVIGARAAPEFLAHAWVEHRGEPVLSPGDESFGRLVEL